MTDKDWLALATAAYPDALRDGYFSAPCDYRPIGDMLGSVLLWREEDDYQGDTFALYRDGGSFGFLKFGWGSCSGCDALQACGSLQDVASLAEELSYEVKWFGSHESLMAWLDRADERAEWYRDREPFLSFREDARKVAT